MALAKQVRSRLKFARSVIAAGRTNADDIVAGIQTLHGADAIDPVATRTEILSRCDLLARVTNEFETDCQVLDQEAAEDILAREKRDDAASVLGEILVTVRGCTRDRLGPEALRVYRLDERNPENREGLARYAADVQGLLQQNPVMLTDDILGSSVATVELAGNIGTALGTYRDALDDVAREARETERARMNRDRTEQRFRRVLQSVAALIVAYLRLAGKDELAARIRFPHPRSGITPGDDQPDTDLPESAPVDTPNATS
jgi:hypothetical protein